MKKLKVGDKVKILKAGHYNSRFDVGDIVYVVGTVQGSGSGDCPYYLSKDKGMDTLNSNYFGPFREAYELYIPKNIIGGRLL